MQSVNSGLGDGWGHREYKVKKQKLLKKIISRRVNKKNKTEGVLEKLRLPVKVENETKKQEDVNRTAQPAEESKGMGRNEHLKVNSVSPTNFDRNKLLAMMKNYTFKSPNKRRLIFSPKGKFSAANKLRNNTNDANSDMHHIDLANIKKNLCNNMNQEQKRTIQQKESDSHMEKLFFD